MPLFLVGSPTGCPTTRNDPRQVKLLGAVHIRNGGGLVKDPTRGSDHARSLTGSPRALFRFSDDELVMCIKNMMVKPMMVKPIMSFSRENDLRVDDALVMYSDAIISSRELSESHPA